MPEHTPAPTPARAVYGFVLYLASVTSAALFLLWAYVPPDVASSLGLSYLPQRYWAVALPVHLCVGLALFAFFFYPGLGLAATPALSDPQTVGDECGRGPQAAVPGPGAVPPVADLPVSEALVAESPAVGDAAFELEVGEQPWLSLLELPRGALCSGTIVSPTAVLSAALCLNGVTTPARGTAYAGNVKYRKPGDLDPLTQNRPIVEYHLYDENNTLIYNFMLVKIAPKWTWSGSVQPIGIIEEERLPQNFRSVCYVSGLGDGGHAARAASVLLEACARRLCYRDATVSLVASAGDRGGPVLCHHEPHNRLYGIISEYGQSGFDEHQEFNRVPALASGFEFVGFYMPWIKKTAGDLPSEEEVKAIRQQHEHDFARPLGVNGLFQIQGRRQRDDAAPDGGAAAGTTEGDDSGAEWQRGGALAALLAVGAACALF